MVYPRKVLHVTVNAEGLISCWDDRDRALLGKEMNDVYIPLLLTLSQTERIKEAIRAAKKRSKNGG